jgi:hypothetical protein
MGSLELGPVFHCYRQWSFATQANDFISAFGFGKLFERNNSIIHGHATKDMAWLALDENISAV